MADENIIPAILRFILFYFILCYRNMKLLAILTTALVSASYVHPYPDWRKYEHVLPGTQEYWVSRVQITVQNASKSCC
jgi:hypothetical protein